MINCKNYSELNYINGSIIRKCIALRIWQPSITPTPTPTSTPTSTPAFTCTCHAPSLIKGACGGFRIRRSSCPTFSAADLLVALGWRRLGVPLVRTNDMRAESINNTAAAGVDTWLRDKRTLGIGTSIVVAAVTMTVVREAVGTIDNRDVFCSFFVAVFM
ncbi:hypothetical protein E2C01_047717 [Portunus trituberculatus]|uniref:Uncharacterized protein n=1 Tax=Portunus trituberculatus TaxID=210409 RepID=A0A5B7G8M8_PORTR|nr:hypothetical protein [Portunus trituberculatus]